MVSRCCVRPNCCSTDRHTRRGRRYIPGISHCQIILCKMRQIPQYAPHSRLTLPLLFPLSPREQINGLYNYLHAGQLIINLSISCCFHLEHRASVKRFVSLQFLNLRQSAGLLGRRISPTYLHRTTWAQNKRRQTSIPWVGFEPTIAMFVRAKTFHALSRAVSMIGWS
jgi:hypothetical protein